MVLMSTYLPTPPTGKSSTAPQPSAMSQNVAVVTSPPPALLFIALREKRAKIGNKEEVKETRTKRGF